MARGRRGEAWAPPGTRMSPDSRSSCWRRAGPADPWSGLKSAAVGKSDSAGRIPLGNLPEPVENKKDNAPWFDDYAGSEEVDSYVGEYDLTSTPNDFNVLTIVNFLDSGAVIIPGFQRNFVWDIKRASKLIESMILGLPVPPIYLYEEGRNRFLVIDGQQRLMSLYYFTKGRFPKKSARGELRALAFRDGPIERKHLDDDRLFQSFALQLPRKEAAAKNPLHKLKYSGLGEYKTVLDLRPLRNVVIKQNHPQGDDSSVFEIFSRLNSGGVNLNPHQIRSSLYHSDFLETLYNLNLADDWRAVLGRAQPDAGSRDVEIMLRGFALLLYSDSYKPSMVKFLNEFCRKGRHHSDENNEYLSDLFLKFCSMIRGKGGERPFATKPSGRFNLAMFESVLHGSCASAAMEKNLDLIPVEKATIERIREDEEWLDASIQATTDRANVLARLRRARELIEAGR